MQYKIILLEGGTSMRDIKVVVTLTEGYQKRFTEACLQIFKKRQERLEQETRAQSGIQEIQETA